jgi:hypothetical protein
MALADELRTLDELHEKGKLTDQEYADAKSATLKNLGPAGEQAKRVPLMSWPFKALLALLLIIIVIGWYKEGTRKTTQMVASAVHAPMTLKDEVENVGVNSWKAVGVDVPYSGTVDLSLQVLQGNPIDVFVVPSDQLDTMKKEDWNDLKVYSDFNATKTRTFRRTGELGQGSYYFVLRDTSPASASSHASDISVKVQLTP